MPMITDAALDDLLQYIIDNAEDLHINFTQEPTTYTEATSTYSCGDKQSISVGAQSDRTPNGRKSTVAAITDGDVTATQTAGWWSIVKVTATSELLAANALAATQLVTALNKFSLTAFDIGVPDAVSA